MHAHNNNKKQFKARKVFNNKNKKEFCAFAHSISLEHLIFVPYIYVCMYSACFLLFTDCSMGGRSYEIQTKYKNTSEFRSLKMAGGDAIFLFSCLIFFSIFCFRFAAAAAELVVFFGGF